MTGHLIAELENREARVSGSVEAEQTGRNQHHYTHWPLGSGRLTPQALGGLQKYLGHEKRMCLKQENIKKLKLAF